MPFNVPDLERGVDDVRPPSGSTAPPDDLVAGDVLVGLGSTSQPWRRPPISPMTTRSGLYWRPSAVQVVGMSLR